MSKNRKQMLAATFVLAVILACYFGVKEYSEGASKKQAEEEAAKIKQVTSFEITDVTAFSYSSKESDVSMQYDGEAWKCIADETLEIDAEKVEAFLENFNAIESENEITDAEDVSEFGLDSPAASIIFEFAEGGSLTCAVGDYNDVMGVYYFKTDASGVVYTVDETIVNQLSNTTDSFVVEAEEGTAEEAE